MSTGVQPQNPTAQAPAPSGGAPTSNAGGTSPQGAPQGSPSQPQAPAADPWRAGNDAPEWARGKTPEEILGIAKQLAGVVQQHIQGGTAPAASPSPFAQSPHTPQPSYGGYQPPQPQQPSYNPSPDEYVTGRDLQTWGQQAVQQVQPQLQAAIEMTASGNLAQIQRDYATAFQKYGPEIYSTLANVPKNAWTVDNLRKAVKFVLADHVEDLAREQAARVVAEMDLGVRSSGGAPTGPVSQPQAEYTLQSEKLPSDWKERAAKAGLTEQALDEFCRANDMTRAQWFTLFDRTAITEVTRG